MKNFCLCSTSFEMQSCLIDLLIYDGQMDLCLLYQFRYLIDAAFSCYRKLGIISQ